MPWGSRPRYPHYKASSSGPISNPPPKTRLRRISRAALFVGRSICIERAERSSCVVSRRLLQRHQLLQIRACKKCLKFLVVRHSGAFELNDKPLVDEHREVSTLVALVPFFERRISRRSRRLFEPVGRFLRVAGGQHHGERRD